MSRFTTAVAACAAIGAIAGGVAAPASAQTVQAPAVINACGKPSPSVNDCVNWTFNTASQTVTTIQREFDRVAGPYVCDVNWILTGTPCP